MKKAPKDELYVLVFEGSRKATAIPCKNMQDARIVFSQLYGKRRWIITKHVKESDA